MCAAALERWPQIIGLFSPRSKGRKKNEGFVGRENLEFFTVLEEWENVDLDGNRSLCTKQLCHTSPPVLCNRVVLKTNELSVFAFCSTFLAADWVFVEYYATY